MKRGYARVSTSDQCLDLQVEALKQAGCEILYKEQGISGAKRDRPALNQLLADLEPGDTVVIWKLDRLGRSLGHLVALVESWGEQGVGFSSLTENIDTSTAGGELVFHIMGAMAQFERSLIAERTKAGLDAAKGRGVKLGRPKKMCKGRIAEARKWIQEGKSKREVARLLQVSPATLYRHLNNGVGR